MVFAPPLKYLGTSHKAGTGIVAENSLPPITTTTFGGVRLRTGQPFRKPVSFIGYVQQFNGQIDSYGIFAKKEIVNILTKSEKYYIFTSRHYTG